MEVFGTNAMNVWELGFGPYWRPLVAAGIIANSHLLKDSNQEEEKHTSALD